MNGKVTINHKEIEKISFACLIFVGIYDRINKKRSNIRGDCIMSQLIDKNGKTEERFLREYDVTQYFRPSVTADAALCVRDRADGGKILLIESGGHPFIGMYAFPGGFTEKDEPCEQTAVRELEEETGISGVPLRQLLAVSTPERDPRWRNITVVYYALLDKPIKAVGGDDATAAKWFDFTVNENGDDATIVFDCVGEKFESRLRVVRDAFGEVDINNTVITERGKAAFDHAKIVNCLFDKIRSK